MGIPKATISGDHKPAAPNIDSWRPEIHGHVNAGRRLAHSFLASKELPAQQLRHQKPQPWWRKIEALGMSCH